MRCGMGMSRRAVGGVRPGRERRGGKQYADGVAVRGVLRRMPNRLGTGWPCARRMLRTCEQ